MYMKLLKASHKYRIVNKLGEWQTGSNSENVIKYIFTKYNIKICASVCVDGKGWGKKGIKILLALLRMSCATSL